MGTHTLPILEKLRPLREFGGTAQTLGLSDEIITQGDGGLGMGEVLDHHVADLLVLL